MRDRNGWLQQCSSRQRVTARSLLSFLLLLPAANALQLSPFIPSPQVPAVDTTRAFTLRHIFHRGTYQDPDLHKRLDIKPETQIAVAFDDETPYYVPPPRLSVESEIYNIERLSDRSWSSIQNHLDHASMTGYPAILDDSQWTMDQVDGPNTTDKNTIINLALMAANAYVPNVGEGEWSNVTEGYNHSTSFGWEGDGLRGHIFADEGNNTIIIGLKGTSPAVFDGDGTTTRDKVNDNLFFSCCCAQGGQYFWRQVCDCQSGTYSCNSTCLIKALKSKTRYYGASIDLYNNVTALYPNSNIWIVGHSLGGAVSSLLGLTFGLPVVTFEAPGDDLAARRLGLPVPPTSRHIGSARGAYTGARHFGHTADPIYMGTCNTATATCTIGGYAMESQCHTGLTCIYDTVADFGWRVGIGYHKIHNVIDSVIKKYDEVPRCIPDDECYDCFNWKFFKSNGSEGRSSTTTTSSTTSPLTRTTTCKTPGWWGCLDDSSSSSTPIITTTYTTTTCLTPGWFGCNVEANTTITTTTEAPTTTSKSESVPAITTSTCQPGWFGGGCTSTKTTVTSPSASSKHHTATATKTHNPDHGTCKTPGFFWGCRDKRHTHTSTASITSAPSLTTSATSKVKPTSTANSGKCKHPVFFGLICLDSADSKAIYEIAHDDADGHSSEL